MMARPKTKSGEERFSPSEWEIMRIRTAALPQKNCEQREIQRFLMEVVGPEPEYLELVEKAVARRIGKKARKRPGGQCLLGGR